MSVLLPWSRLRSPASIVHGICPQKEDRSFSNGLTVFSANSLLPYRASRDCASARVSPDCATGCSLTGSCTDGSFMAGSSLRQTGEVQPRSPGQPEPTIRHAFASHSLAASTSVASKYPIFAMVNGLHTAAIYYSHVVSPTSAMDWIFVQCVVANLMSSHSACTSQPWKSWN